jgi:hypothetical protein
VGLPVPCDGCGEGEQFRAPSFSKWSSFFTIGSAEQQSSIVKLRASDEFQHGSCGRTFQGQCARCGGDVFRDDRWTLEQNRYRHISCPMAAVGQGVRELHLQASSNSAVNRFDRSIIITIEPLILVENRLDADIVVWQRSQHLRALHLILAPGETRPFLADGPRDTCRLSVNLVADGINESCAEFVPEEGWGRWGRHSHGDDVPKSPKDGGGGNASGSSVLGSQPILLRCSSGRMLLASLRVQGYNTVCVSIGEVVNAVPHR